MSEDASDNASARDIPVEDPWRAIRAANAVRWKAEDAEVAAATLVEPPIDSMPEALKLRIHYEGSYGPDPEVFEMLDKRGYHCKLRLQKLFGNWWISYGFPINLRARAEMKAVAAQRAALSRGGGKSKRKWGIPETNLLIGMHVDAWDAVQDPDLLPPEQRITSKPRLKGEFPHAQSFHCRRSQATIYGSGFSRPGGPSFEHPPSRPLT